MVDKINDNRGLGPLGQINRADKPTQAKKNDGARPTDRVDFSNALQKAENVQSTGSAQEAARMEKVAAIKSQIQEGTYKPDLNKVAASLLPFLMRES